MPSLTKSVQVELMPVGLNFEEALNDAFFDGTEKTVDSLPVFIDETKLTLYGRVVSIFTGRSDLEIISRKIRPITPNEPQPEGDMN